MRIYELILVCVGECGQVCMLCMDSFLDKKFFQPFKFFLLLVIGRIVAKCLLLMVLLITYRPRWRGTNAVGLNFDALEAGIFRGRRGRTRQSREALVINGKKKGAKSG